MAFSVTQRLNDIVEFGIVDGAALGIKGLDIAPLSLKGYRFPCMLPLPRPESAIQTADNSSYVSTKQYEMRFYWAEVGGNHALNLIELEYAQEKVRKLFLERPQLQLKDNEPINEIMGKRITLQLTSNLNRPIAYPFESTASLYWGFIFTITIPYQVYSPIKVKG